MVRSELEARALAQFDSLVEKGELFWEPSDEIEVKQEPFNVYFRISRTTQSKPYNPNDTSRKPGFLDDDPEFTLCDTVGSGSKHKLIMNKFCWLRPQMILHTRDFQSQTDLLGPEDFDAAVDVLAQLGAKYMVIFNGGPDAGSSVAHKHLQVFPRPSWETVVDKMIANGEENAGSLPFAHRLYRVKDGQRSATQLYREYQRMCEELSIVNGRAHNYLLVDEWMLVIPRSCATIKGEIEGALIQGGANAMIGMLWLKTPQQLENWKEYGPIRALTEFGVAPESDSAGKRS